MVYIIGPGKLNRGFKEGLEKLVHNVDVRLEDNTASVKKVCEQMSAATQVLQQRFETFFGDPLWLQNTTGDDPSIEQFSDWTPDRIYDCIHENTIRMVIDSFDFSRDAVDFLEGVASEYRKQSDAIIADMEFIGAEQDELYNELVELTLVEAPFRQELRDRALLYFVDPDWPSMFAVELDLFSGNKLSVEDTKIPAHKVFMKDHYSFDRKFLRDAKAIYSSGKNVYVVHHMSEAVKFEMMHRGACRVVQDAYDRARPDVVAMRDTMNSPNTRFSEDDMNAGNFVLSDKRGRVVGLPLVKGVVPDSVACELLLRCGDGKPAFVGNIPIMTKGRYDA